MMNVAANVAAHQSARNDSREETYPKIKLTPNLPCRDLHRTVAFYSALGYSPTSVSDSQVCVSHVGGGNALLLQSIPEFTGQTGPFFAVHNSQESCGAIYNMQGGSRATVERLTNAAVAAGGRPVNPKGGSPTEGYLQPSGHFSRMICDPDGRLWEICASEIELSPEEKRRRDKEDTKTAFKLTKGIVSLGAALGGAGGGPS